MARLIKELYAPSAGQQTYWS